MDTSVHADEAKFIKSKRKKVDLAVIRIKEELKIEVQVLPRSELVKRSRLLDS